LPEALAGYGPNVYAEPGSADIAARGSDAAAPVNIACFGAVRPLKNQLAQALAALSFGDAIGRKVRFHINGTRVEGNGDPILRNIRSLFAVAVGADLIEHGWLAHREFLELMRGMDLSLQASFSETFNIVCADAMACSVPVVASQEVPWVGEYAHADPTEIRSIAARMVEIWREGADGQHVRLHRQRQDLLAYCRTAEAVWLERFGGA
jgi:glycosyltransferase involved in cell wall biosynthesis